MAYILGDVYIGDYPITQSFGANPDVYSARYGLKGHNGVDIGCPSLTMILSAADGVVTETGFDAGGYGNYIKITHQGFLTLYGHLNDLTVKQGDHVVSGQLIGHSNNTGFSDGPHLHFGVAPCDANGVKTDPNNGYSGYIDPMVAPCEWQVKNLTEPVNPQSQTAAPVQVDTNELNVKSVQANNFVSIVNFGMSNGLGVFLTEANDSLDLKNNPADTNAAEKVNRWIASLLQTNQSLQEENTKLTTQTEQTAPVVPSPNNPSVKVQTMTNFFSALKQAIKDFVFVSQN